jgi:hypothetical protein
MLLSRHQNAGQNHGIKTANRSFENVVQLKYFGGKSNKSNFDSRANKRRLNSGNACYHSVQKLPSRLLSQNVEVKIYKIIIVPAVLLGGSLALRENID